MKWSCLTEKITVEADLSSTRTIPVCPAHIETESVQWRLNTMDMEEEVVVPAGARRYLFFPAVILEAAALRLGKAVIKI
jgi:hypothetical protein